MAVIIFLICNVRPTGSGGVSADVTVRMLNYTIVIVTVVVPATPVLGNFKLAEICCTAGTGCRINIQETLAFS